LDKIKAGSHDSETQAISEVYSKSIQILSEVENQGYSIIKTFHESFEGLCEPLRIVYTGVYYDILKRLNNN